MFFQFKSVTLKLASTATHHILQKEHNSYYHKTKNDDSRIDVRDAFPTVNPNHVVPSQSLHCTPETVSQVEPDSE